MACFALELATEMCKFYLGKDDRALAFHELIWERLGIKLEAAKVAGTGFDTDGHASVGFYVYVNTECKNEIGSTVADPCIQSAIYYHHHTKYVVGKVQNSRFQCLHLYYFGSHLGFAGSAFSDRVHYEPLSTLIPFWFSPHDTDMLDTITRFFSAFKKAASKLKTYYTELPTQPSTMFATEEARFPYPTTFTHLRTHVNAPLKLGHQPIPGKLLYVGWTVGQPVVVKFVRSYSKDLHEHCAFKDLAPALLGFERLAGNWFMVVMEYMESYKTLSTLQDLAPISTQLRQMVTELVTSFHDQNFVHGDIRDSNLLVHMEDGELQMKMIDFDWGGREGEVHYPVLINNRTVHRPLAVVGGQLIKREHDLQMVENILSGLP